MDFNQKHDITAVILLSGGLDSRLAVALLSKQGINVIGIVFKSMFFAWQQAVSAAKSLNIQYMVEDFTDAILEKLEHPRYGFGAGINPCIDCHTAMIKKAWELANKEGWHFVATGEVLNQRPMSQNKKALIRIAEESGAGSFLLRPLSALLLPETEPEKRGWVKRSELLDISGKSRKRQTALAKELNIHDYPQPAGGCILTDPGFGRKMRDLRKNEGLKNLALIELLRIGRHFRINGFKFVVGRNEEENNKLLPYHSKNFMLLYPANVKGATALLDEKADEATVALAAAILARYCDKISNNRIDITIEKSGAPSKTFLADIADEKLILSFRL
jgi:tRNA U34 2-thiouridine synthase MnmA/TrmU